MLKTLSRRAKKSPRYLHILISRLGLGAAFYRLEMRVLFMIFGWNWVQSSFFGFRVSLIARFLSETGLDSTFNRKIFTRFNLVGSAVTHWWFDAFQHWNSQDFDQVARIEGWEHFENAQAKGKGVILVHHHLKIAHLVWPLMERRGYRDRATIGKLPGDSGNGRNNSRKTEVSDPTAIMLNYARQFQAGKEVLGRGGVIRIVPDGFRGGSAGIEFPFFNRLRVFRAGFADLALLTGAKIIPTSVSLDDTGSLTVTFHPALQPVQNLDKKRQSAELVSAYVNYLEGQWEMSSLRFMAIPNIQKFLELPVAQVKKRVEYD